MAITYKTSREIAARIYLTGGKFEGFNVLIKDKAAAEIIWTMPVPTMKAGNAVVRALRDLEATGGIF